jgi:hypothetical protein
MNTGYNWLKLPQLNLKAWLQNKYKTIYFLFPLSSRRRTQILVNYCATEFKHLPKTYRATHEVIHNEPVYYAFPLTYGLEALRDDTELQKQQIEKLFGVVRYINKDMVTVKLSTGELVTASGQWFWPLREIRDINRVDIKIQGV